MKKTTKKFGFDTEKFSFGQLTSNSNGKTSATGTAGLYIIAVGGICFLLGCIDKMFLNQNVDIVTQSIIFVGIGAGLLGYRKSKQSNETTEAIQETVEETEDSNIVEPGQEENNSTEEELKPLNS
jgi:hypothetical protein